VKKREPKNMVDYGRYDGWSTQEHHFTHTVVDKDPSKTRYFADDVPRYLTITLNPDRTSFPAEMKPAGGRPAKRKKTSQHLKPNATVDAIDRWRQEA